MSMIERMAQAITWRRRRAESPTNGGRNILGRWLPHRRGGVKLCANRNPPAVQRAAAAHGGPQRQLSSWRARLNVLGRRRRELSAPGYAKGPG